MKIKRILIAGSRSFSDYDKAKEYIDSCLSEIKGKQKFIIVSGGAKGADLLGERYAKEKGYKIDLHLPDWETYGRGAAIVRNKEMAELSDLVICFWDGKSKGTKSTIDFARKKGKSLRIKEI